MRLICNSKECTGCGLCLSQCPNSCITMRLGKLGHLFPKVDNRRCVDCGLCKRKCPVLNPVNSISPQRAYAAWSKDEFDYKSSTSGGASSVIAQYIIHLGGVVYGCTVLPGAIIEHIRIDSQEDLYKIKGSKYVQSSIVKVLPLIKKDIDEGRTVLFIGTPCQVVAVRKLFRGIPDNLYLVDLVCHGTPSQKSLHNYLKQYVSLDSVEDVKFRSDEGFIIKAFSNNQVIYSSTELWRNRYKDYYYNSFMDGLSYRESCYKCSYSSPNRVSDITIGDFWGLGKEIPCDNIPEHRYGVSLVLPITNKGSNLFQKISSAMNVFERPLDEAIKGNDQLRHPKDRTKSAKVYRFLQFFIGEKRAYSCTRALVKLRSIFKFIN